MNNLNQSYNVGLHCSGSCKKGVFNLSTYCKHFNGDDNNVQFEWNMMVTAYTQTYKDIKKQTYNKV
jgi:hypothetical protein